MACVQDNPAESLMVNDTPLPYPESINPETTTNEFAVGVKLPVVTPDAFEVSVLAVARVVRLSAMAQRLTALGSACVSVKEISAA